MLIDLKAGHPGIAPVWRTLVHHLLVYGRDVRPRGKRTKEVLGVQLRVKNSLSNLISSPSRDLNARYAVCEAVWIMAGRNDLAPLVRYNKRMADFSDDGKTLAGAYGPRIVPQLPYVVESLRRDPESRQAVIGIWTPSPQPSKDTPCTITAQALIRRGKLITIWSMRSSDAWLGIPYDFFVFSTIANALAGELGVGLGDTIMNLGSSHIYEENWEAARKMLRDWPRENDAQKSVRSPRLPGLMPPELSRVLDGERVDVPHPWSLFRDALLCSGKRAAFDRFRFPTTEITGRRVENGYVNVNVQGHPLVNEFAPARVGEHRLVMAESLGRPLLTSEHVHHVDEDRANNSRDNLKLLSPGEHMQEHNPGQFVDCATRGRAISRTKQSWSPEKRRKIAARQWATRRARKSLAGE